MTMLKRFILAGILALLALPVHGAGLFPLSNTQQFDSNSKVLPGARLFLYDGGTSTPRIAYKDLALTSQHPNPIVADSAGRLPLIYLDDGYYRQRLTNRNGGLIFDQDGIPVLTTSSGGAGTSVDPDSVFKTRDIKIRFDDQPLAGYVRLNGRTIGSASSGATERANADTQSLYEELWSFANISVTGGKGANAAADFAANKPLVLPNAAGRLLGGMDDLGAGAQSNLTTAILGMDPTLPGSFGGAQTLTLSATNLPVSSPWSATASGNGTTALSGANHTHSFSGTTSSDGSHTHTSADATDHNRGAANGTDFGAWNGLTSSITSSAGTHTHTFSGTTGNNSADHNHAFSFSGATVAFGSNAGGGQAFSKLAPMMTLMIFIRL